MNIFIYNLIQIITLPIMVLFLFIRLLMFKENINSIKQKIGLGLNNKKRYDYIVHVASLGELNSLKMLNEDIFIEKNVMLTCSTLTAYKLASKKKDYESIRYLPYDYYFLASLFLSFNKCEGFIWIDSEIWPNYLTILKKRKINTYLINGRISEKSYKRWLMLTSFIAKLGSTYSKVYSSSFEDKIRLEKLFKRKISYHGNLKFYQELNFSKKKNNIITFASIHLKEFKNIIGIIKKLKINNFSNIYIIPRHPRYSGLLKKSLIKNKLNYSIINVIDKVGENKKIYKKSKIVFMGGSLFEHGGQNPLEPLALGCYILSGPYVENFIEIYKELNKEKCAYIFDKIGHKIIADKIEKLIYNKNLQDLKNIEKIFNRKNRDLKKISYGLLND